MRTAAAFIAGIIAGAFLVSRRRRVVALPNFPEDWTGGW